LQFTHVFIDESSQAQMPEVLVPIALTSPHTQLVRQQAAAEQEHSKHRDRPCHIQDLCNP
jgi:hypothetical protein